MKKNVLFGMVTAILFLMILAGCGSAAAPSITVESGWGRPSMDMPTAGGMFMLIKNSGSADDHLVSGSSPACGSIELHEVIMKSDGSMGMNLLDKPILIPAGGQVELKPGDLHVMCIMKKDDVFMMGNTVDLTLVFEKSGEVTIPVEIKMGE